MTLSVSLDLSEFCLYPIDIPLIFTKRRPPESLQHLPSFPVGWRLASDGLDPNSPRVKKPCQQPCTHYTSLGDTTAVPRPMHAATGTTRRLDGGATAETGLTQRQSFPLQRTCFRPTLSGISSPKPHADPHQQAGSRIPPKSRPRET